MLSGIAALSAAVTAGLALNGGSTPPGQAPADSPGTPTRAAATAPASEAASQTSSPASRLPSNPLDLIPAESLAVWKGSPLPDESSDRAGTGEGATFLELLRRVLGANLDARTKLTLRLYELVSVARGYHFAVACIDAAARSRRPDGGGTHADRLKLAFVVDAGDDPRPFLSIIARAIKELTDAGPATLEKKSAGRFEYQELYDNRLPAWCRVAWGRCGRFFVLTLGEEVWPQVAAVAEGEAPSIGTDGWVRAVRSETPNEPVVEIVAAASRIRRQLDPFVMNRATAFFEAWGCAELEQIYWAIGFRGEGLYCQTSVRDDGQTTTRRLADPEYRDAAAARTIPAGARFAVFRVDVADVLTRLVSSYYATQRPAEREQAARAWEQIQLDLGFDAQRDVLDRLGGTIVMHNVPAHPLRLPLMFTALYEIRGDGAATARTLERICRGWLAALERSAQAGENEAQGPTLLQRDGDGIWYLQLGPVAGLAWTFTDRYIITSWSPMALREYLAQVGAEDIGNFVRGQ